MSATESLRRRLDLLADRLAAVRSHADRDVIFVMPVYRDADVARRALRRLRKHYPGSRIALISDGDEEFPGDAFVQEFGVEYRLGENLYAIDRGGDILQRILDVYLEAPGRWLIRLDTDARLDRRFRWLPGRDGLYGRIGRRSGTAQGGCVLLTDAAARRLDARGVFRSPRLHDPVASWGRFSTAENLQRKLAQGRIAYDKVLHWGCVEAGVPVRPFSEIHAVWKWSPAFEAAARGRPGRFAIVHPDKMETEA